MQERHARLSLCMYGSEGPLKSCFILENEVTPVRSKCTYSHLTFLCFNTEHTHPHFSLFSHPHTRTQMNIAGGEVLNRP